MWSSCPSVVPNTCTYGNNIKKNIRLTNYGNGQANKREYGKKQRGQKKINPKVDGPLLQGSLFPEAVDELHIQHNPTPIVHPLLSWL